MTTATTEPATLADRNFDLLLAFNLRALEDASVLDNIPFDAQLVLLPDDDPEVFEANLAIGVKALRRGEEVVFHHMRRAGG